MNNKANTKLNILTTKNGFSLVEVMVVLVIMGILAALVGPNAIAYIDRMNVKTYISSARLAEDTTMALSGMQYSEIGNPQIGNPALRKSSNPNGGHTWADDFYIDENEFGKQYVYLDSVNYQFFAQNGGAPVSFARMAPANLASTENRDSAGIREYASRTGEPIPPPTPWSVNSSKPEQYATFSVFITADNSNLIPESSTSGKTFVATHLIPQGQYIKYNLYGSWFNRVFDGKYITVLHNFKLSQNGNEEEIKTTSSVSDKTFENSLLAANGWYVYEYKDYDASLSHGGGTYYLLDSQTQE